ncbi:MAG: hypothetical protein WAZ34_14775 [Rhodocyclaceae bacterium]
MSESESESESAGNSGPISIHTARGPLHGQLAVPDGAGGLIILAHAGFSPESQDNALAAALRHAGFATLTLDLLPPEEARFADAHNNVPLLTQRLLDGIALIKRLMQDKTLPSLPLGLCAAGDTSPVIVRASAQRDRDIAAIVCRGGLIDLAGGLYLRLLTSPLLVLIGEHEHRLLVSSQRALREVACNKALEIIPDSGSDFASETAFAAVASSTVRWFETYCRAQTQAAVNDRT